MIGDLISLGSLIVAAVAMIVGYLQRNKQDAARDQHIEDKLDLLCDSMSDVKISMDKLDGKLDDHSVRISRIESEQKNIYKRLDRLEGRLDRHFGPSKHEA